MTGEEAARLLADRIAPLANPARPPVIGLNGAQGSGKSTMARETCAALRDNHGMTQVTLSLDDFYLPKQERQTLAREIHPLCATRGVPGTHDVALLQETLDSLLTAGPEDLTALPGFDKLADDRNPATQWRSFVGRPDIIMFEGWCTGVREADLPEWTGPINDLERQRDPEGAWFAWSHRALTAYEPIWNMFGLLISIEVPDMETVVESRMRQEQGLKSTSGRPAMDRAAVEQFVQHYERYTLAIWAAMPDRADILLRRDKAFNFSVVV